MSKILVAKLGLDGHDMGATMVTRWLRDAGHEVVYLGLYNTPETLAEAAAQEDVDVIGLSFLGGEHLYFAERLLPLLHDRGLERVLVVVGGVIPPDDQPALRALGVQAIFTPGTPRAAILDEMARLGQRVPDQRQVADA